MPAAALNWLLELLPPPAHPCSRVRVQSVPEALAGKENAVAEDSRVLAAAGLALEESCRQLEGLRQQKAAARPDSGGGSSGGSTAAKDGEQGEAGTQVRRRGGCPCAEHPYCRAVLHLKASAHAAWIVPSMHP